VGSPTRPPLPVISIGMLSVLSQAIYLVRFFRAAGSDAEEQLMLTEVLKLSMRSLIVAAVQEVNRTGPRRCIQVTSYKPPLKTEFRFKPMAVDYLALYNMVPGDFSAGAILSSQTSRSRGLSSYSSLRG